MARTKQPNEQVVSLARKRWGEEWLASLAEFAGVSERTIRRWANGETRVPVTVLKLLSAKA